MATNWLKIRRAATFGQCLGGHNLVIFIRFWRSTTLKWSAHQDESNGENIKALTHPVWILVVWATFCHLWPHWARGPKSTPPGCRYLPYYKVPSSLTNNSFIRYTTNVASIPTPKMVLKGCYFISTCLPNETSKYLELMILQPFKVVASIFTHQFNIVASIRTQYMIVQYL